MIFDTMIIKLQMTVVFKLVNLNWKCSPIRNLTMRLLNVTEKQKHHLQKCIGSNKHVFGRYNVTLKF